MNQKEDEQEDIIDMTYPNEIIENKLYLGDVFQASKVETFKNLKITHVINCTKTEKNFFEANCNILGGYTKWIKYMRVSVDDKNSESISDYFDKAFNFIENALNCSNKDIDTKESDKKSCQDDGDDENNDNESKNDEKEDEKNINDENRESKVFVHCQMGVSRSSTIVISYMMRKYQLSFQEALKLVKSKRQCVKPASGFEKQLKHFETTIL